MSKGKKKRNDNPLTSEIDLENMLEVRKLRPTKPRKTILEVISKAKSHPNANEIYMKVRERLPNVSMGTVYRNLNLFKEKGIIYELECTGTPSRFEIGSPDHSHFVCERCGKIIDIEDQIDKIIEQKLAERLGAIITFHRAEFYGLCKECGSATA